MTNISVNKLDSSDFKSVQTQLVNTISRLNKNTANYLIDELLTETERIMIVKRFGAIFLFSQSYTPYKVSRVLGLSIPTSSRLFGQYRTGQFDNLLRGVTKKEMSEFMQVISDLILSRANYSARQRLQNRFK